MPALQHQLLRHFGKQRHGSAFLLQAAHGQVGSLCVSAASICAASTRMCGLT